MEQLEKNIYSIRELEKYILTGESIAIYGVGDYGRKLIDYLIHIQKNNKIIGIVVSNRGTEQDYKGINIFEAGGFFVKNRGCHVIIAVSSAYQEDIANVVRQFGSQYRFMTQELYSDIDKKMDPRAVSYKGIDFLCPGFTKCGTSSLYNALKKMNGIYLSKRKENHFFEWCNDVEDAEEILIETFFDDIKEGQKVGIVDPTYAWEAKKVHDFLGDKVKIIYLVRNPVNAAFSGFKMAARDGWTELDTDYQNFSGVFSVEMFAEYFKRDAADFEYIDWIEQFEKYYTAEHMKVVFLEELIKSPQMVLNDILDFIGVSERYEYEELPLVNEGSFVMADEESHKLARLRRMECHVSDRGVSLQEIRKRKHERKNERQELQEKYKQAKKIYGVKMTAEQRKKAEAYYYNSVRKLETWLNKDLSEIWF